MANTQTQLGWSSNSWAFSCSGDMAAKDFVNTNTVMDLSLDHEKVVKKVDKSKLKSFKRRIGIVDKPKRKSKPKQIDKRKKIALNKTIPISNRESSTSANLRLVNYHANPGGGSSGNRFLDFCELVLKHEGYLKQNFTDEERLRMRRHSSSPPHETRSDSSTDGQEPSSIQNDQNSAISENDESDTEITCFCKKPFGGKPMVECDKCGTWIHMKCDRVKKEDVKGGKAYYCPGCRLEMDNTKKRKKIQRKSTPMSNCQSINQSKYEDVSSDDDDDDSKNLSKKPKTRLTL